MVCSYSLCSVFVDETGFLRAKGAKKMTMMTIDDDEDDVFAVD